MWFSCNALPVPDCLNDCCEAQCFCSSNSPRLKPNIMSSELAYSNTSQENCLGFPCSCGRARRVGPELGLTSLSESPSLSKITRDAQSVAKPINPRQALSERLRSSRGVRDVRSLLALPGPAVCHTAVPYYGEPEALGKIAQTRAARDQASGM